MISDQPALNSNLSFLQKIHEANVWNGIFTLYALFSIFLLFFILNRLRLVLPSFMYMILSALPVFFLLFLSSQSDPYRLASGYVILFFVILILISSLKKYLTVVIILYLSSLLKRL